MKNPFSVTIIVEYKGQKRACKITQNVSDVDKLVTDLGDMLKTTIKVVDDEENLRQKEIMYQAMLSHYESRKIIHQCILENYHEFMDALKK